LLFTPGPLTTSFATKQAALFDMGSRDSKFIQTIHEVRQGLLDVAGVSNEEFTSILMQGSGTFCVEAVISSVVDGKLLIVANGAYGKRMTNMCDHHNIPFQLLEYAEDTWPEEADIARILDEDTDGKITHLAVVQSETTSGIINDVDSICALAKQKGRSTIVDAMSCFGVLPVDFTYADFMVSSANKCLEGIPGFAFAIGRKSAMVTSRKPSSLVLDIQGQVDGLAKDGQFRWTPPTHCILAFRQALREFDQEGGMEGRAARYRENQRVLQEGMEALGFELYLPKEKAGFIISSYRYPADPNWDFQQFYSLLVDRGFALYPGKVSNADCFRIGHIGRLFPEDTQNLVNNIGEVMQQMGMAVPLQRA
jgi:2-aminoethylphosphonate-pyruvate transaminase